MSGIIICPVCGSELVSDGKAYCCENRHSFDISKEGYVNLLRGHSLSGDNKQMTVGRSAFLSKGYYNNLAAAVGDVLEVCGGPVLDICAGEGYYSSELKKRFPGTEFYGFDISKEMVRLAAKRKFGTVFAANLSAIPVKDESFGFALHLFAPFCESEFARILKKGGTLVSVIPGARHLYGLKSVLYDNVYLNEENPPVCNTLKLVATKRVSYTITLDNKEDIQNLFGMTPYYYKTPENGVKRLYELDTLTTEVGFILLIYKRN